MDYHSLLKNLPPLDISIYDRSIRLLQEIKLLQGNTALNATLRRHSDFRDKLIEIQRRHLNELEKSIDVNES